MKNPLDVSYDVPEVDGLTEARKIVSNLKTDVVYNHPAWHKLYRVNNYLEQRQHEVLDAVLGPDAEVQA